jgi:hypothetical protein
MGFVVACPCGRDVGVTSGDAGTSVPCDCGRSVAVPSLGKLRRSVPPLPVVPPKWECPRCDSTAVVRLPPSSITPHPGYKCHGCGVKLRARGMGVVYAVVLVIGSVMFVAFVIGGAGDKPKVFGLGAVCAVYSAVQLLRPAPRRHTSPPTLDDGQLE